ncbi:MAG: hypothetical protein RML72_00585 [Bacteroidia bacterium]|nr:hypothetical protein [Bacteroidia bacterium]MDW8157362.1 hypothetical protein [Bacteroidia bacterium]
MKAIYPRLIQVYTDLYFLKIFFTELRDLAITCTDEKAKIWHNFFQFLLKGPIELISLQTGRKIQKTDIIHLFDIPGYATALQEELNITPENYVYPPNYDFHYIKAPYAIILANWENELIKQLTSKFGMPFINPDTFFEKWKKFSFEGLIRNIDLKTEPKKPGETYKPPFDVWEEFSNFSHTCHSAIIVDPMISTWILQTFALNILPLIKNFIPNDYATHITLIYLEKSTQSKDRRIHTEEIYEFLKSKFPHFDFSVVCFLPYLFDVDTEVRIQQILEERFIATPLLSVSSPNSLDLYRGGYTGVSFINKSILLNFHPILDFQGNYLESSLQKLENYRELIELREIHPEKVIVFGEPEKNKLLYL